jgi:alkylhydroperoxidase/carboxymuconolactone decarboxylase family protein YurZ
MLERVRTAGGKSFVCVRHNVISRRLLMPKLPNQYTGIQKKYKGFMKAVENLGKAAKAAGPLNEKTARLIQLAAAASSRSEGSVHSHARRALASGAKPEEIRHAIILLTSTIGFPAVSAALSWVNDVLEKK